MIIPDICDYCGEYAKSPYTCTYNDVWYYGHKRCMGAPMIRKLSQPTDKNIPNIALCGELRSGKDSVGAYLSQYYGYTRFAFGDELKRYAHELFGESDGKQRGLYQWFGQTMRERDPGIWVRKCFENIDAVRPWIFKDQGPKFPRKDFRVVITDLRQPNEYARCRSEGYVIIRVTAPESTRITRAIQSGDTFDLRDLTHDTESHVSTFAVDYEIVNDGTLAELHANIDTIMTDITAKKSEVSA